MVRIKQLANGDNLTNGKIKKDGKILTNYQIVQKLC